MISPLYTLFFIFLHIIKTVYSQDLPGGVLGMSACDSYSMDFNDCGTPDVPVETLPKECTSFLYMNIYVDNTTVYDEGEQLSTIPDYLDQLIQTDKPVLVYYYHGFQIDWCAAVASDPAVIAEELNNLKCFLDEHPGIQGIILRNLLEIGSDIPCADCPDYTKNLKAYIDSMHTALPDLSIGIILNSMRASELYNNSDLAWLDYSVLNSSIDFYVVTFQNLNPCTDEFAATGIYPLCESSYNTVEMLKTFLHNVGIPTEKIHYTFYNYGDLLNGSSACVTQPTTYCQDVENAKTSICMDTLQTLYEKGQYAKANGVGFVVNTIDSDDYGCACQCGQSFPGFHAILNGYNGDPAPPPCALFDRT